MHGQLGNLTQALRELRQLLWKYSRGGSSASHHIQEHILCSCDPHRGAAPTVWPLQDLIFGCLVLITFWM
ncbi:hypothetical protein scyTo_0007745 [Scyliorhinus torazame]|uniref:Uncharacterized protein n=1 Tax=Scyliorhinus torazame TaxID=75743 RepID=A0A401NXF8_SCYTO|nr:hypothetical protein [Scyliorhinus torazame]